MKTFLLIMFEDDDRSDGLMHWARSLEAAKKAYDEHEESCERGFYCQAMVIDIRKHRVAAYYEEGLGWTGEMTR